MISLHWFYYSFQHTKMTIERLIPFLAKSIKARRERLCTSYQSLAQVTGLSAEYLAFIELGQTNFSMKTLSTIADALNVPPSELIADAERLAESEVEVEVDGSANC